MIKSEEYYRSLLQSEYFCIDQEARLKVKEEDHAYIQVEQQLHICSEEIMEDKGEDHVCTHT